MIINTNREPPAKPHKFLQMKIPQPLFHIWLGMALLLMSCQKDDISTDVSVFTEEIVFASGEQAIMTGRVLAQAQVAVDDHGFQISTNEGFSAPTVISLGPKDIPGRFVGQTDQLNIHQDYFCRAYIQFEGETITGNVLPFSTLVPKALDFNPKEGTGNTKITIEGINLTADTKVLWNGMTIVPDNIIAESFVEFSAPPLTDDPTIDLQIVAQGETSALPRPFEYIIGTWTEEGVLDDMVQNNRHIFFEDGNDFIYGLGLAQANLTNLLQVMDKNTYQRTAVSVPASPVEGAFFNAGYFGGGSLIKVIYPAQQLPLSNKFWKYENHSVIPLADVPLALYKAVALVADGRLWLYGGEKASRERSNAVYVYDPATDSWSLIANSPISPLNSLPSFHFGQYNYFVTEESHTYRHDYLNDKWERVADYPTQVREYGVSLTLNDAIYVGMQNTSRRIFVYRPGENVWRTKKSLDNNTPFRTVGGWVHNGKIFVSRVQLDMHSHRILWSLDPDAF